MKINIGLTSLANYNSGELDFDSAFKRFEEGYSEANDNFARATAYEMDIITERGMGLYAGGEGIFGDIKDGAKKVGKQMARAGKGAGHIVIRALNWLSTSLGELWDSLMKYDKKYKNLTKNIDEAIKHMQTGKIGEQTSYSFHDVDVESLKKAVIFLDFEKFLDIKVNTRRIGAIFDERVVSEIGEDPDAADGVNLPRLRSFAEDASMLKKGVTNAGMEGIIYQVLKENKVAKPSANSLGTSGSGDNREELIKKFQETILGNKVEITGPDFVTAASKYLSLMKSLAGDKIILANLRKSGDQLKRMTKRLSSVIDSNGRAAKSYATTYQNTREKEKEESEEKQFEDLKDTVKGDTGKRETVKNSEETKKANENLDEAKRIRDDIESSVTVIGSVITNAFMTTTKATLGAYKMLLDETYTAISYIMSL